MPGWNRVKQTAVRFNGQSTRGGSGEGNDGPYEFRKAVRSEIFAGVEWIEIAISGGIADTHGDIAASHMTRDEVEAVIDKAHRHGVRVTAHSGAPAATLEALDLGLDCVEAERWHRVPKRAVAYGRRAGQGPLTRHSRPGYRGLSHSTSSKV